MTSFLKNHKAAQRRPQLQLMGKYKPSCAPRGEKQIVSPMSRQIMEMQHIPAMTPLKCFCPFELNKTLHNQRAIIRLQAKINAASKTFCKSALRPRML